MSGLREAFAREQVERAARLQVDWELMKMQEAGQDPAERNRDGIDPPLYGDDPAEGFERRGEALVEIARKFDNVPREGDADDELSTLASAMELLTGTDERTDVSDGQTTTVDDPRGEFEHLASAGRYVGEWDGDAAESFQVWLEELPQATYYQYSAASALRGAVTAERDMWKKAGENIDDLLYSVRDGLDKYEASLETAQVSLGFYLSVAGAVLGTVGTGGAALPMVIGALGVAGAFAGEDWEAIGEDNDVTGEANQPILVVESAAVLAGDLEEGIRSTEQAIADSLSRAANRLWTDRELARLREPALANPPAHDNDLYGPDFLGDPRT